VSLISLREIGRTVRLPDGKDLEILRDINLDVEAGERVSIVGRSGSGKSTLLNQIGRLDTPTKGMYRFDDIDTKRLSSAKRDRLRGREFGFVFQQFNLLPGRTAIENVMAPLLYATGREFWNRRKLAQAALETVGLGERLQNLPTQLSGGEQQRVAIARALVRKPRAILADEPTGALDVETGQSVMRLLREVTIDTGAALIVITHDPAIAALADRVVRLDQGQLVDEAGTPISGAAIPPAPPAAGAQGVQA